MEYENLGNGRVAVTAEQMAKLQAEQTPQPAVSQPEAAIEACRAAIRYDEAIQSASNDPRKMSSFCTVEGESLDSLYADWLSKSRAALAASPQLPVAMQALVPASKMSLPYPGMAEAFESHFGQSFTDKDWRNHASTWAAAWKIATRKAIAAQTAQAVPAGWKLVPFDPTPEMVDAAEEAHMPFGDMHLAIMMATNAAPPTQAIAVEAVKEWLVQESTIYTLDEKGVNSNCITVQQADSSHSRAATNPLADRIAAMLNAAPSQGAKQ